jgi:ABC-type cobalamin transport system ATPase subunit
LYAQMLLLTLHLAATAALIIPMRSQLKRYGSTLDKVAGDLATLEKNQTILSESQAAYCTETTHILAAIRNTGHQTAKEINTVAQVLDMHFTSQRADHQLTDVCSTGGHRIHRRAH